MPTLYQIVYSCQLRSISMLTFEIGKKPFSSICDNNQVPFHSLIDFSWTKMTAENF